jgi:DNA-binding beta-propeller fold protein YncE
MHTIGQFGASPGKFTMISGTQPTITGTLLIADGGQNNIQEFDLLTGAYVRTLFGPGTGLGQFRGPSGMEQDPNGMLFVADFHNNRIQVFDRDYKALSSFGQTGRENGEFFGPLSMSFDPKYERLFVTDSGNSRVVVLDRKGAALQAVETIGRRAQPGDWGNGTFLSPFGVAVGPKGDIYVSDQDLQLIEKFDATGHFVSQWGGWGTEPGQFYKPKGISVDQDGNLYVIDFGNHRGQIFDENGKFLAIFGEGVLYPPQAASGK